MHNARCLTPNFIHSHLSVAPDFYRSYILFKPTCLAFRISILLHCGLLFIALHSTKCQIATAAKGLEAPGGLGRHTESAPDGDPIIDPRTYVVIKVRIAILDIYH